MGDALRVRHWLEIGEMPAAVASKPGTKSAWVRAVAGTPPVTKVARSIGARRQFPLRWGMVPYFPVVSPLVVLDQCCTIGTEPPMNRVNS